MLTYACMVRLGDDEDIFADAGSDYKLEAKPQGPAPLQNGSYFGQPSELAAVLPPPPPPPPAPPAGGMQPAAASGLAPGGTGLQLLMLSCLLQLLERV